MDYGEITNQSGGATKFSLSQVGRAIINLYQKTNALEKFKNAL